MMTSRRFARALALAATLCLGGCLGAAWGIEPVARLKGPATAAVDSEFWLKFTGSVGDEPAELELAEGPEAVEPALLYSRDGTPIYGMATASTAGKYVFVVVAMGKPEGAAKAKRAYAFWTVVVGQPAPPPTPVPPTPIPPGPTPPTPDDPLGLGSYTRTLVQERIPLADRPAGAASIAVAYRETVRLARDGKFANPQAVIVDAAARMVTARPTSWSTFVLSPKLNELARAGKIVTIPDVVLAFEAVAGTLEAISRGE